MTFQVLGDSPHYFVIQNQRSRHFRSDAGGST